MKFKPIYSIFIIVIFFITICFFWGEIGSFDLAKKINHEKFNSYFASIGALGTAFSFYLIYEQVKEAKKQNHFAFQAKLFLESKSYKIDEKGESSLTQPYIGIVDSENAEKGEWGIKLINVGNGTALRITAEWQFDHEAVNKISEKYYRDIKIMRTSFFKDYLRKDEILYIGLRNYI